MHKILYLGTDPSRFGREVVHCPLIEVKPLPLPDAVVRDFDAFTHVILTSPNAARLWAAAKLQHKKILSIGRGTAEALKEAGWYCFATASPETQEGMIDLLKVACGGDSYLLYPRSSRARPLLANYLKEAGLKHQVCNLYDTVYLKPDPLPSLDDFEEIVFTSPSTIEAFLQIYGSLPKNKTLTCIGPVTSAAMRDKNIFAFL